MQPYGDPATQSRNSGGTARRRRSGARQGPHRPDRAAQDRRSEERRPVEDARKKRWRPKAAFCRSTPSLPNTPRGAGGGGWYLVSRTPVITGQDMRNARPAPDPDHPGRWETSFTLSQDGARRFEKFTAGEHRQPARRRAGQPDPQRRDDPERDQRFGRINGLHRSRKRPISRWCCSTGALPAGIKYEQERTIGPSLGADSIREGIYRRHRRADRRHHRDAGLLQEGRHQRGAGAAAEHRYADGGALLTSARR